MSSKRTDSTLTDHGDALEFTVTTTTTTTKPASPVPAPASASSRALVSPRTGRLRSEHRPTREAEKGELQSLNGRLANYGM